MSFSADARPFAIRAEGLGKTYRLYDRPADRLKQIFLRNRGGYGREFHALADISFELGKGEVLGLVGRNGAGKSTLLQMICGTLTPSVGRVEVNGRIAALLELGAGFNPDFSGRENVFLNAAVLGLPRHEIEARYDEIVSFSGIGAFIEQPVKTYSSGMYVRLAFAIATSVEPDILIVDEALSVGDGEFARKSFDRIMHLRDRGATILFCSHSLFQIESICSSAIWLDKGRLVASGNPKRIVSAYQAYLDQQEAGAPQGEVTQSVPSAPKGHARLTRIRVAGQDVSTRRVVVHVASRQDDLAIDVQFASDPTLPTPSVAVTLHAPDQRIVASAGAWNDGVELVRDATGQGRASVCFEALPLLKGRYSVSVHLFCERGLHQYDAADHVAVFEVLQGGVEQGMVHLPHRWQCSTDLLPPEADAVEEARGDDASAAQGVTNLAALAHAVRGLRVGEALPTAAAALLDATEAAAGLAERFGLVRDADAAAWRLRRPPRWFVQWATAQDRAGWMQLFKAAFGYEMSDAVWRWKYAHAEPIGSVVHEGDRVVAFYGGMPRAILYFGQAQRAVQIGDVMVHPSARGALTRNGPFMLSAATYLEQQVGYDRPYLLGFGFPNTRALRLAQRLGLYAQVDSLVELRWPVAGAKRHLLSRTRPLMAVDQPQVESLWQEMAAAFTGSILGRRDWDFFAHRYLAHPDHPYQVLLVRSRLGQRPLGVVVLRDRDADGVELLDILAPPQRFPMLIDIARRYAAHRGRASVFAWVTASHARLLASAHVEQRDLDIGIPCNTWSPGPDAGVLSGRWWLMSGDMDFR